MSKANKNYTIMCEECMTKGLITDEYGGTWLQDENQVNHLHEHRKPLALVYKEGECDFEAAKKELKRLEANL